MECWIAFWTKWFLSAAMMVHTSTYSLPVGLVIWSLTILMPHNVVKSLTFELPDRNRMCFFETVENGSRCHFEFQASRVIIGIARNLLRGGDKTGSGDGSPPAGSRGRAPVGLETYTDDEGDMHQCPPLATPLIKLGEWHRTVRCMPFHYARRDHLTQRNPLSTRGMVALYL